MQSRAGKCQSSSQLGSISIDDGIDDPITRFTVVVAFHRSSFHLPIDSDAIQLNAITSNYDCILNIFGMMFGFKLILVSQRQLQSFLNRSKLATLGSNLTGFFCSVFNIHRRNLTVETIFMLKFWPMDFIVSDDIRFRKSKGLDETNVWNDDY